MRQWARVLNELQLRELFDQRSTSFLLNQPRLKVDGRWAGCLPEVIASLLFFKMWSGDVNVGLSVGFWVSPQLWTRQLMEWHFAQIFKILRRHILLTEHLDFSSNAICRLMLGIFRYYNHRTDCHDSLVCRDGLYLPLPSLSLFSPAPSGQNLIVSSPFVYKHILWLITSLTNALVYVSMLPRKAKMANIWGEDSLKFG